MFGEKEKIAMANAASTLLCELRAVKDVGDKFASVTSENKDSREYATQLYDLSLQLHHAAVEYLNAQLIAIEQHQQPYVYTCEDK